MKENQIHLSLEEAERLCGLYMECRLSLLEETELQYVLGKLDYSSPVIDEARTLMDISLSHHIINDGSEPTPAVGKRKWKMKHTAAAASAAAVLALGASLWISKGSHEDYYCQVFENGREMGRNTALSMAETEMQKIDRFIERMIDIDSDLQEKTNAFDQR